MRRRDEEAAGAALALPLRIVAERGEPRQLVDGHVDLHHRAVDLDRFDAGGTRPATSLSSTSLR